MYFLGLRACGWIWFGQLKSPEIPENQVFDGFFDDFMMVGENCIAAICKNAFLMI